ncbi:uncharacterized protein CTRU02_207384 [Colletotrichum truncatum]|uniref:Uncharacterized protein n=1 Tax=Colletotrichum truncatum TaxID=5467 RepID=A0ACC3Z0P6_COLTU|nr:uncharacterized protein CTRU02_00982 [Colletotrichum truncatum]KAF6800577.1 hypothetical protein CTRU02_00982 [Colletotrichum truncatum]
MGKSTIQHRLFTCVRSKPEQALKTDATRVSAEGLDIEPPPAYPGDETSHQPSTPQKSTDVVNIIEKLDLAESTNEKPASTPSEHKGGPLSRPVVIPRVNPGSTFPFARAWAPELQHHGVPQSEWLSFLDSLNILTAPHPGVTAAQVVGVGVAFAPFEGADGIAALIEVGATGLTYYMAKAKCDKFIDHKNEEYFNPRGLHARIVSGKSLRRNLGLDKKDPLMAPLGEDTLDLTPQDRCLEYLKDRVCKLDFNIPEPEPETKTMARLASWRVKQQLKDTDKKAKAARKRSWKRFQKGKKLKECREEKSRVKRISWVIIQSIEDFEKDKALMEEEAKTKKSKEGGGRALFPTLASKKQTSPS